MARYIKANPRVAAFLGLMRDRNTVTDGNYLLWQADMLAFGPLTQLSETLAQIGGIALLPHEAREEQDGTVVRPLPTATDPRFIVETAQTQENAATGGDTAEVVEEPTQQEESPAEGAETPETDGNDNQPENPENED